MDVNYWNDEQLGMFNIINVHCSTESGGQKVKSTELAINLK